MTMEELCHCDPSFWEFMPSERVFLKLFERMGQITNVQDDLFGGIILAQVGLDPTPAI